MKGRKNFKCIRICAAYRCQLKFYRITANGSCTLIFEALNAIFQFLFSIWRFNKSLSCCWKVEDKRRMEKRFLIAKSTLWAFLQEIVCLDSQVLALPRINQQWMSQNMIQTHSSTSSMTRRWKLRFIAMEIDAKVQNVWD